MGGKRRFGLAGLAFLFLNEKEVGRSRGFFGWVFHPFNIYRISWSQKLVLDGGPRCSTKINRSMEVIVCKIKEMHVIISNYQYRRLSQIFSNL